MPVYDVDIQDWDGVEMEEVTLCVDSCRKFWVFPITIVDTESAECMTI